MTGLSIGMVSSVKWVGFFTTALVGLHTIRDLWKHFGNSQESKKIFFLQFFFRALFLIAVPIAVYIATFYVHFTILSRSGTGDANMSSIFQAGLEGNDFSKSPLEVAFGSSVTIKNSAIAAGLLHSHVDTYPVGSKQQQVTTYHHKDSNNNWMIKKPLIGVEDELTDEIIEFLHDGQVIRLLHEATGRNLHTHNVKAPVSTKYFEVSSYGNDTIADPNDNWIVEIVSDSLHPDTKKIHSLTTKFQLKHQVMGCYLTASTASLPEWGFKQGEVYCDPKKSTNPRSIWNIESHVNEKRKYSFNFKYLLVTKACTNQTFYTISGNSMWPCI